LQKTLQHFSSLLRNGGVRVSTSELLDAMRASELVGLADRSKLKAALGATLVKRTEDRPIFDELFELYFLGGKALASTAGDSALSHWVAERELDEATREALLRALAAELAEMSAMGRVAMGAQAPEVHTLLRGQSLREELASMRTPLQVGYFSYRVLEQLGMGQGEGEARAAAGRLAERFPEVPEEEFSGLIDTSVRAFRDSIRDYVQGQFRQANPRFREEMTSEALADKPLARISPAEVTAMRGEVRRLARLLRARLALRRRRQRAGTLDAARTLRASLATDGVPFQLKRRARPRRRPRLIVLCDVSDSVRNVSHFMLQFVYLLHELFDGVRCFAFVAEVADLSDLFRDNELDRALELALSGDTVNVFANSNYGRALQQFYDEHSGLLNRRTTVLIIGDGRNNYHPSRSEVLQQMQRRARSLIWINPEPPAAWGFGDSEMKEYARYCDRVAVAGTLRGLRKVIDELLGDLEVLP
jgi:uncharacterized protein with von Willebrand factor type A (vWA) domain